MRHLCLAFLAAFGIGAFIASSSGADCDCGRQNCATCIDSSACKPCVPSCKSSWDEAKTKKPKYSMKCDYACARGYDCWCSDPAECRCCPPAGKVYVKKKLYKADGEEKVEKVPKYEVKMVPAAPCDCATCCGVCWWNPLSIIHYLVHH